MQTVAKQEPQSQSTAEPALIPEGVKKAMQQSAETVVNNTDMSGSLSRLLDANSDCI